MCLTKTVPIYLASDVTISVLFQDFPPTEETLANTLKAVIGALAHDQVVVSHVSV